MIFIANDNNFILSGPTRYRPRFSHFWPLINSLFFAATLAIQGCSMDRKMIEEHGRICRKNMEVIVHDNNLWREYRAESEAAHRRDSEKNPPIKWRTLYSPVGEFKIVYGDNKSFFRPNVDNKIVRNDVFVVKGDKVVAQIIDYIYQYRSIDGLTSFNCLNLYKDLVIGDVNQ